MVVLLAATACAATATPLGGNGAASEAVAFGPGEAPTEISPAQFWPDA